MSKTSVTKDLYGKLSDGRSVNRYTLSNGKVNVKIITYGGIITSIEFPDKNGELADIVTGFDTIQEYETRNQRFFGALIGRSANRIHHGKFTLDGEEYQLACNKAPNHLHGGNEGFHKKLWTASVGPKGGVTLTYVSADGEEGYPGQLTATVVYQLSDDNELMIDYTATTDRPTIVNMTNHSYFNLAGHKAANIYDHVVTLNAENYTPKNEDAVPTGEIATVASTVHDLRSPVILSEDRLSNVPGDLGYDHNYCLPAGNNRKFGARMEHPPSGRVLEMHTTEVGLQFYTGNYLAGIKGKSGAVYNKHCAFCMETQKYPDTVHHPNFPSVVLRPGETYRHTTWFKFITKS